MNFFKFKKSANKLNVSNNKTSFRPKFKRGFIYALALGIGINFYDQITFVLFGENYRMKKCKEALQERFEFSGKYLTSEENGKEICKILPSNIYDAQRLMEIANYYKIAIKCDPNHQHTDRSLNFPHFIVDFSKYDKILNFDSTKKLISLEPGVKIFHLLTFLEKFSLTIPQLEYYKFSNLSIGDILFNNFYSFNEGKFLDYLIKEVTVVTPRNKVMNLKQNDDLTLTGLNLQNLFLRSNSTLGLILQIKLKAKKVKDVKYILIPALESKVQDSLQIAQAVKESTSKSEFGIKDVTFIYTPKETDLLLKVKNKPENVNACIDLLKSSNLHFEQIHKDDYLKHILISDNTEEDNISILRKLKINIHKKSFQSFLTKAETLAKEKNVQMKLRCSYINNEIELIVNTTDEISSIDNAYKYINKIHALVLKQGGNIFGMNNK